MGSLSTCSSDFYHTLCFLPFCCNNSVVCVIALSSWANTECYSRQETTLNHSTVGGCGLGLVSVTFVPVTLSHYTEIRWHDTHHSSTLTHHRCSVTHVCSTIRQHIACRGLKTHQYGTLYHWSNRFTGKSWWCCGVFEKQGPTHYNT